MTETDNTKTPKKKTIGRMIWWVMTAALSIWALQAILQDNAKLAVGLLAASILSVPTVQDVVCKLFGKAAPKWAPGALAVGIAMAAIVASPPPSAPSPMVADQPEAKSRPPAPASTLPGRITNATQQVDLYIRDDLNSQEGHRDDYETAMLRNELKQVDDWGTLAFEAMRAERAGRPAPELQRFKDRVANYQTREFPRYRAGYVKQAHDKVWEDDVTVSVRGPRNSTIRLTGAAFAANRNIAEMQRVLEEGVRRARFDRVEYQVFEGGPYSYFDLRVPDDDEVGVWVGKEFMSASRPGPPEEALMLNARPADQ